MKALSRFHLLLLVPLTVSVAGSVALAAPAPPPPATAVAGGCPTAFAPVVTGHATGEIALSAVATAKDAACADGRVVRWEIADDNHVFGPALKSARLRDAVEKDGTLVAKAGPGEYRLRPVIALPGRELAGVDIVLHLADPAKQAVGLHFAIGKDGKTLTTVPAAEGAQSHAVEHVADPGLPDPMAPPKVVEMKGDGPRPAVGANAAAAPLAVKLPSYITMVNDAKHTAAADACVPDYSVRPFVGVGSDTGKRGVIFSFGGNPRCINAYRTVSFEISTDDKNYVPLSSAAYVRDVQSSAQDPVRRAMFSLPAGGNYYLRARVEADNMAVLVGPAKIAAN